MHKISVASDFSVYPGGRTPDDGPYSGEEFRDRLLAPHLKNGEQVSVFLDGTRGYGSSFLEEAFGGLVRNGFAKEELRRLLSFDSARPGLIKEIWNYIDDART